MQHKRTGSESRREKQRREIPRAGSCDSDRAEQGPEIGLVGAGIRRGTGFDPPVADLAEVISAGRTPLSGNGILGVPHSRLDN
jgi:hypothetical protein